MVPDTNAVACRTCRYKDPQGAVQGPHDAKKLDAWFTKGYFDSALLVSRNGGEYAALRELLAELRADAGVPAVPPTAAAVEQVAP